MDFNYFAMEILKRIDILEEAVKEGLQFKRKGKSYFAKCPFHEDSTPSFSINPQKQVFNCFGCGKKGNAITMLALLKDISKGKIIYRYASYLGLIQNGKINQEQQREMEERAKQREFIQMHQQKFNAVYILLSDMMHSFKRSMSKANNMDEVIMAHELYRVYDVIPYYEHLLDCMLGQYGEVIQVETYLVAERIVKQWHSNLI
ncbi:CHC2 zinc finger domain-containing protein [Oceanobacillus piezotolerans]|nr:CHC2 zinc finger domain-containing protein [Oceanobacillus piezotolerans]